MSISRPWYQSSRSTLNTLRTARTAVSSHAIGAAERRSSVPGSGDSAGGAGAAPLSSPTPGARPGSPRAPVLQPAPERLLERDRGLPAGGRDELRVVAEQDLHVGRAQARRVLLHLDLGLGQSEEHVEGLADGPAAAATEIVNLAGLAFLERQHVSA